MPKEFKSDSSEMNPVIEPRYNPELVGSVELDGVTRNGQFSAIQEGNIEIKDLMIISQALNDRLSILTNDIIHLQEERDKYEVSSVKYFELTHEIQMKEIGIENTKTQIINNDNELERIDDENKLLVKNN